MYVCIDDNIATRMKSNTNEEETTLTTRLLKITQNPDSKFRHSVFRLVTFTRILIRTSKVPDACQM